MGRNVGKFFLGFLTIALLVFTGTQTVNLIQLTLPPDQHYVGYVALAAFDFGVLIWIWVFMHLAEGATQLAIAAGMAIFDFVAVALATYFGMTLQAGKNGVLNKADGQTMWLVISILAVVLVVNAGAGAFFAMFHPAHRERHMKKTFEYKLKERSWQQAEQDVAAYAEQLAPAYGQYMVNVLANKMASEMQAGLRNRPTNAPLPAPVVNAQARELPNNDNTTNPIKRDKNRKRGAQALPISYQGQATTKGDTIFLSDSPAMPKMRRKKRG